MQQPEIEEEDMTNKKLSSWLTTDIIISCAIILVSVSISYATLAAGQKSTDTRVTGIEAQQETMTTDISQIQIDVAVIKSKQEHTNQIIKKYGEDMTKVLEILMRYDNAATSR